MPSTNGQGNCSMVQTDRTRVSVGGSLFFSFSKQLIIVIKIGKY
jgi:hypothetical protein